MIKINKGKAKFNGSLPVLAAELAVATHGIIDAHIEAGISWEDTQRLVRHCIELGFKNAAKATGNAPKSSEEDADV